MKFLILSIGVTFFVVFGLSHGLPSAKQEIQLCNEQMIEKDVNLTTMKTPPLGKNPGELEQFESIIQQKVDNDLQLKDDPATKDPPLNGNTFFFFNKYYRHAKLAQWGTGGRDVGPFEPMVYPDQLWYLEESIAYPGFYYIYNAYHQGYRLAKWGSDDHSVGVYNGNCYDDQLWRFQKEGDSYRIFNKEYSNAKLTQFGREGSDFGTYTGPNYDDQLWRLVPRFEANITEATLWFIDNREGTSPVTKKIIKTTGVTLSNSETVSTKFGFETSLTASLFGIGASVKFSGEISHSMTSAEEKSWSEQVETTFQAPAGMTYRVLQSVVSFSSTLSSDDCALYSGEQRIEEHH